VDGDSRQASSASRDWEKHAVVAGVAIFAEKHSSRQPMGETSGAESSYLIRLGDTHGRVARAVRRQTR